MAPSPQWADVPWPLIETPSATMDISKHTSYYIANEMAFAHNCMLRGLNAIYLQARQISDPTDASDFLFFVKSWCHWILHHHVLEEKKMFPAFEAVEGVTKGVLDGNVDQHHAFSKGLQNLATYAETMDPTQYDGLKVIELIDVFGNLLHTHLVDEILTLKSLDTIPEKHAPELLKRYKECEAEAGNQDRFIVPPMVFGLSDKTYGGGNAWPLEAMGRLGFLGEYVINLFFARRHAGAWRFLPSNGWRQPRELGWLGEVE